MKKTVSMFLALAMVFTAFAACTQDGGNASAGSKAASGTSQAVSETEASGETVKFTYVVPGDEPREYARGIADVNAKLAADNVGIEVELKFFAWDVWDQKINLMLSTGEEFDAFHVMNDRVSLTNYASRGALADISSQMDAYGSNITENVPALAVENGKVNGKTYGIPAFWVESALNEQATIRKDLLEKYNLEMPKTFEALTAAYKTVMENWDGESKPYFPSVSSNDRIPYFFSSNNDFCIYDNLIYVDQDGTIVNYYETETFKEAAKNAQIWYREGLISPDILTTTSDQSSNQLNTGNWFVLNGTIGSVTTIQSNVEGFAPEDIVWLDLTGGAAAIRPYGVKNIQAVPAASLHPESAVKFFDWLYSSQENYDLFIYGKEGVDYTTGENHTYEPIVDADLQAVPYSFATWMGGNINYSYLDATTSPEVNRHLYTIDENAVDGIAAGFSFDASSVQTQLADVNTQISAVLTPMAWGVTDYDSGIEEAISLLKKAGVDDVINAFKEQYEASK